MKTIVIGEWQFINRYLDKTSSTFRHVDILRLVQFSTEHGLYWHQSVQSYQINFHRLELSCTSCLPRGKNPQKEFAECGRDHSNEEQKT